MAINVPAATAVPITPATLGPIACIRRKLEGSASEPTFCETLAAIGTADTPAEPISGLTLPCVTRHIILPNNTPAAAPAGAQGAVKVNAPMPGKILKVNATAGAAVKKGDVLVVLEAMKMENEICAPQDGTIATVECAAGDSVESGKVLVSLN
jgi:biotin carboxyl carrier protein